MRQTCYKLCPKVREHLQKAQEARKRGDDEESSDERAKNVAGPSRLQPSARDGRSARGSRESSRHHARTQSTQSTQSTKRTKRTSGEIDDSEDCCDDSDVNGKKSTKDRRSEGHEKITGGRKDGRNGKRQSGAYQAGTSGRADEVPSRSNYFGTMMGAGQMEDRLLAGFDDHEKCDSNCHGIHQQLRMLKNDKDQELLDEYIINKAMPYFADLCNCHFPCLVNQLWKNSFVTSTVTSTALFAIGVKLCSELDGWTISNTF